MDNYLEDLARRGVSEEEEPDLFDEIWFNLYSKKNPDHEDCICNRDDYTDN